MTSDRTPADDKNRDDKNRGDNPLSADGHAPGDHPRQWDAAYVLGALAPRERLEYEAYLAEHESARSEVAELAGLPGLLRALSTAEAVELLSEEAATSASAAAAPTSAATVQSLARRVDAHRRRRRVLAVFASAAAAVVLVVGGFTLAGLGTGHDGAGSGPTESLAAMSPAAGSSLTAEVGLVSKSWGTRLDWNCTYASAWTRGSGTYDLVVTDRSGRTRVVASWQAIGGKATDLSAATDLAADDIGAVSITVSGSRTPLATRTF